MTYETRDSSAASNAKDGGSCGLLAGCPSMRAQHRQQLIRVHRFHQMVVEPAGLSEATILRLPVTRERNEQRVRRGGCCAQALRDLVAIHPRQPDVEDDGIR
jgi:hypothetical protein